MLQHRIKWKKPQRNMQPGDVVMVKDKDAFQRSWPLGRIEKVYPGQDGVVRVADVWSQGRLMKRPIAKLVALLDNDSETSSSGGVCSGAEAQAEED